MKEGLCNAQTLLIIKDVYCKLLSSVENFRNG